MKASELIKRLQEAVRAWDDQKVRVWLGPIDGVHYAADNIEVTLEYEDEQLLITIDAERDE